MKNKKILFLLISVLIIILFLIFIIVKNFNSEKTNENSILEYTPEEEISSTQLRETKVVLYFLDKTTNELKNESRLIDSALLLQDPYRQLVELLLTESSSESLSNVFPSDSKLLGTTLEHNCVILNFSKELLNYENDEQKFNIINSLLNTLTQLNEVNSIQILIEGEKNENFSDEYFAIYQ